MARQETIEVRLARSSDYTSTYTQLRNEAQALERLYANLRIGGGNQSPNSQAAAARAAAQAAQQAAQAQTAQANATAANLRVQREQVNLYNAQQRTVRDLAATQAEQTRLQREQNELATAGVRAQTAQTNQYNAQIRTVRDLNDVQAANIRVQTEQVNLQTAQIRQQNAIQAGNARQATALRNLGQLQGQVNQGQAQNIQYMTEWIHSQNNLAGATVTATGTIRNAVGTFQTYNAAMAEAGGVTHNYRIAVNTLNGEVYQLDKGIKTTALSLTDLSVIFRAIRTVVGFTGIAQSFRSAFSEMKNMSDAMAEYRKVTGATTQEMETLRDTAYEVAKAYGESASGVIASAANMARAGYKENSLAMAELATKTKLVGDMTQEAADKFLIAVDAAYKYNGSVEQLSGVLDAANALDNQYATTIEKISDGMTLVASLASTAHVPVEQLMAALGTMTAVTQRSGAETARGLRSIILNVIGDTSTEIEEGVTATEESVKSMTDALIKYGDESVKAAAKAGKIINPMEAIVALQKAWKANQITEEDLYKISNDVAGKRYYNVFTALIQNPEMYNDMLQSIAESMGSAQNEIDILMDSWSKKLEKLKTTWTQLVNQSISEGFIKDLIDGATAALEFAGSLENLAAAATGALMAFRSLSAGISNLRTGRQFGGFNLFTTGIGLGIAGISAWKSAYENAIREIQESAAKSVANALEETSGVKTLESLVKRYSAIASDGIQIEQGELEELKTLQDELNGLVGDQATAIDIVNGKYGETIIQLQNLTKKQKEAAEISIRAALSEAVAAFNSSDLNGWSKTSLDDKILYGEDGTQRRFSMTNIAMDAYSNKIVKDYIDNLTYLRSYQSLFGDTLYFNKPDNAEEIVAFYKEVQDFYTFLGTTTSTGEKATKDAKSLGEEYSGMYSALGKFVQTIKDARAGDIESALEAIDTLYQDLEDIGESGSVAEDAADGLEEVSESALTLAGAIDAATKAKEKFDDAMKTSKADAMNGYITAFQTLQEEINAGRVNSTAFYASARMLLGDEAYNATGGMTENVMAALKKKGASGSIWDAYEILSQKYYDKAGNEVEGGGLIQLLMQTAGYDKNLVRPDGSVFIPELTDADLSAISAAWGGISKEFILSVFDALDQYDIQGNATDDNVKAGTTGNESAPPSGVGTADTESPKREEAAEGQKEAAETLQDAAQAQEEAAQAQEEAAQTLTEEADKQQEQSEAPESSPTEEPYTGPNAGYAIDQAQQWLELLEDIEIAYTRVANLTIGGNPDLEELIADIASLKEEIHLNIQTGGDANNAAAVAGKIADHIAKINSYAQNGKIDITVACQLTGDLQDDLQDIINNANSLEELDAIQLAITGDSAPLDEEIAQALEEKREALTVDVTADTSEAQDAVTDVTTGDYTATVDVEQNGASDVEADIDSAAAGPYSATIDVEQSGAGEAQGDINEAAEGPYSSTITVGQDGAEDAGNEIGDAASDQYSTIHVDQSGASTAQDEIKDTADGPYNSTINVKQSGAALVEKVIASVARDRTVRIYTEFVGENGEHHTGSEGKFASGTRNHPGGLSLVNDGNGPELIVENGQAFIAGNGKPTLISLEKGAKVFTASETRQIMSGNGIPAYEYGTYDADGDGTGNPNPGNGILTPGVPTPDAGTGNDGGNSGGGGKGKKSTKYKFDDLKTLIDYIIEKIGNTLEKQIEVIDRQIDELKKEREKKQQEDELEKKRKDVEDAETNRTVRYLGEDGKWHWGADQNKVEKAKKDLADYEDELEFNKKIEDLEKQKQDLKDSYNGIAEIWKDILDGINTPTGDINKILEDLLKNGKGTDKKGAEAVKDLLDYIGRTENKKNLQDILDAIKRAAEGNPILPGDGEVGTQPVTDPIIGFGGGTDATSMGLYAEEAMRSAEMGKTVDTGYITQGVGGTQFNYNYFIDGVQIGSDKANEPLSVILRDLSVYTEAKAM